MNLAPYVFDVNHGAKIRSRLYIDVLEKNSTKLSLEKNDIGIFSEKVPTKFSSLDFGAKLPSGARSAAGATSGSTLFPAFV